MNLRWHIPKDASLTMPEADEIVIAAQKRIDKIWSDGGFRSNRPIISTGIVYAVFYSIQEMKSNTDYGKG